MTEESPVVLRVYDISRGMAKSMSMAMLGKQIDGIWHSGLKVFGRGYSFGGGMVEGATSGISIAQPHEWEQLYGPCAEEINLGTTAISRERFDDFVKELGQTSFTQASFDVANRNCNHFAHEAAKFLTGKGTPPYLINQVQEALSGPQGAMVANMLGLNNPRPAPGQAPGAAAGAGLRAAIGQERAAPVAAAPAAAAPAAAAPAAAAPAAAAPVDATSSVAPAPPICVDADDVSVTLAWAQQQQGDARWCYELQYRKVSGGAAGEEAPADWTAIKAKLSGTTVRKKNLESSSIYEFRLRGVRGVKDQEEDQEEVATPWSTPSAPIQMLAAGTARPPAPRLHAGAQPSASALTVAWDAIDGAEVYEVQWRVASSSASAWESASNKLKGTAVKKKGLEPSTSYQFRVRGGGAAAAGGEGAGAEPEAKEATAAAGAAAAAATSSWGPFSAPSPPMTTPKRCNPSFGRLLGYALTNASGDKLSLDHLPGDATVLLYFSASWCPPCRQFTPMLAKWYVEQKARGKRLEVIFVSSDKTEPEFQDYLRGHHGPWLALPFESSARGAASRYFKVEGIPKLMVFSPSGRTICDNAVQVPLTTYQMDAWEKEV